jgi:hypothetical protein
MRKIEQQIRTAPSFVRRVVLPGHTLLFDFHETFLAPEFLAASRNWRRPSVEIPGITAAGYVGPFADAKAMPPDQSKTNGA